MALTWIHFFLSHCNKAVLHAGVQVASAQACAVSGFPVFEFVYLTRASRTQTAFGKTNLQTVAAVLQRRFYACHCTPPAPMKTVLMGGSEDTRSCTSEDDVTRCCGNSVSCEANGPETPNMQGTDPDEGREWSEEEGGGSGSNVSVAKQNMPTELWLLNGVSLYTVMIPCSSTDNYFWSICTVRVWTEENTVFNSLSFLCPWHLK